jgi:hypothetical protein
LEHLGEWVSVGNPRGPGDSEWDLWRTFVSALQFDREKTAREPVPLESRHWRNPGLARNLNRRDLLCHSSKLTFLRGPFWLIVEFLHPG